MDLKQLEIYGKFYRYVIDVSAGKAPYSSQGPDTGKGQSTGQIRTKPLPLWFTDRITVDDPPVAMCSTSLFLAILTAGGDNEYKKKLRPG